MNHKFGKLRLCFAAALLTLGTVAVAAPSASALVRPRTATPYSVPLVIAHNQCTAPNQVHNPANLAGGSCVPETKTSPYLTAGEPPTTPANFEGRLHLVVCVTAATCTAGGGSGATDVLFPSGVGKSYALDIRCEPTAPWLAALCPTTNAAGGRDYGSGVPPATASLAWATAVIRITDRNNGPAGGPYTNEGTVEDLDFPVPAICQPTANTGIGGTCTPLIASANGACGGCVAAGKLSNVEIDDLVVQDPGLDGNATTVADNNDAARPGVFIP